MAASAGIWLRLSRKALNLVYTFGSDIGSTRPSSSQSNRSLCTPYMSGCGCSIGSRSGSFLDRVATLSNRHNTSVDMAGHGSMAGWGKRLREQQSRSIFFPFARQPSKSIWRDAVVKERSTLICFFASLLSSRSKRSPLTRCSIFILDLKQTTDRR